MHVDFIIILRLMYLSRLPDTMKTKKYSVWLLIIFICPLTFSEECVNFKAGIPKNVSCDCDTLDNSKGWSYTCFEESSTNLFLEDLPIKFILKYVVYSENEKTISFECRGNEIDYESLLQQINHSHVRSYIFKSCPLPNVSYGNSISSFEDHPLQEIRIENTKDNRNYTAELFEPISENLKVLKLVNNGIENLPESIFQNFTKLQYLSLVDNQLKSLPEKIFHPLSTLSYLELANNHLEYLPENIFEGLFQLKYLYLYRNKLKNLPHTVFKSLASLQILDLSNNRLNNLSPDSFLGLSHLKNIRLVGNWLQTLPKELFSYTLNIAEIKLSINSFMEPLPETLFHNLIRLENLTLEQCNITYIHENFFGLSTQLTNLELQNNKLQELPENIFRNNSKLKQLNLDFNAINLLPPNLLISQKSLETLSLYGNNITVIPEGFFRNTVNIKTLNLGQNKIKHFSQAMFRDLPNLEIINLVRNQLTNLTLYSNREIKEINLSHNNITEMPRIVFTNHLKLQTLNLQYNKITYFEIPLMYSTSKRSPSIKVDHNNIKTVDVQDVLLIDDHLHELPAKHYEDYVETEISLSSNPFVCDCYLYRFYEYLKKSNETPKKSVRFAMREYLFCHDPPIYRDQSILRMKAEQFTCDLDKYCTPPCHCFYRVYDDSRIVNCSGHQLKQLPEQIPSNTSILYFQKNSLTSMKQFNNARWDRLTEIFLDDNQISTISGWKIPSSLKFISLINNRIRRLPEYFLNYTSGNEDFQVNLSKNPWTCNCSTTKFKTWLAENFRKVPDANDVLCSQRFKQNGTLDRISVLTIADDVMCPLDDWPYRVQMITVATVCAILALSLFIVSVLYYRNKQTVIAYLYIHMHPFFICFFSEEDFDEDKTFDAFVAYGHDDCDVAHKLIDELEPHFQLCIHERNWIAGNQISWNILNSVYNSRRTILVVSKQFIESMWFQVEFRTAYYQMLEDKIDRLIIIVKGELPPKETLDKELLYLLSTKTYLIWEERWFWEKLRYAMPHKKHQALQGNTLALKDKPDIEKIKNIDYQIAISSANSNRATDKVHEVVQNGTNRALSLVNGDAAAKRS